MLKCGICGKTYTDSEYMNYAKHVQECAENKKVEELKKANAELEEVKRAKICYEGLRDAFKEKYPDIYMANFLEVENKISTEAENECLDENPNTENQHEKDVKDFLDLLFELSPVGYTKRD